MTQILKPNTKALEPRDLKLQDKFDHRRASERPMPACVAKAYRRLLDQQHTER